MSRRLPAFQSTGMGYCQSCLSTQGSRGLSTKKRGTCLIHDKFLVMLKVIEWMSVGKVTQRHQVERIGSPEMTSDGMPGIGDQIGRSSKAKMVSIGSVQGWSARSKSPQWMGMNKPWLPIARKVRTAP